MTHNAPNVIYILGDDHRAEYLGCAGHEILQTPHLDRLADEGVRFAQAFCTSPACTPSRTCHYTGQWERKHGINFNSLSSLAPEAWEKSFPMRLKDEGYFIGWVGKNHVPAGGSRGYDSGYLEDVFDYWYGNHHHSGFYPKENGDCGILYRNAEADTQAEIFTEGALNFLKSRQGFRDRADPPLPERPLDKPFCLCVTFNLPHDCSTTIMEDRPSDDELYKSAYRDQQDGLKPPATFIPHDEAQENPRLPRSVYNGRYLDVYDYVKTAEALSEQQLRTCQTVSGMDRFVGRIRDELKTLGLADDTIIVFSTDHGIHHGEHGLGGKCFLYEEDIHVPLIVYDPRRKGRQAPGPCQEFALVPDLAPTILDLCDVDVPETMQGRSLRPFLEGEAVDWRQDFFTEQLMDIQNYPRQESVRNRDWKYIRYFARTEDQEQAGNEFPGTLDDYNDCLTSTLNGEQPVYEELFNLKDDPGEVKNLATDNRYADQLERMRARLLELGREAKGGDGLPLTIPYGQSA